MAPIRCFLLIFIQCILSDFSVAELSEEAQLDFIYSIYDRETYPGYNNTAIVVKHGLSVINIVEFDDTKLVIDVWEEMEWNDERLVLWTDKPRMLRIPRSRVWLPDIVLYNRPGKRDFEPHDVLLNSDGTMFYVPATRLETRSCVSVENGETECSFKFGSWNYSGDLIDLQLRTGSIDLSNLNNNILYELVNATTERNVVNYSCCPESYPDITYKLRIKPKKSSWWPW